MLEKQNPLYTICSGKCSLLAAIYSKIRWIIIIITGHMCGVVGEQSSEKIKNKNIFYLLVLLMDKMEKNVIEESLTSPAEAENGAVRPEDWLGQQPCKMSPLIGWHSELEDQHLLEQV